jgi:hypothetical protein
MKVEPVMEVSETSRPNLRNVEVTVYAVKPRLDACGNPVPTILLPRPVIDGSTHDVTTSVPSPAPDL